jgi:hypothetical protein
MLHIRFETRYRPAAPFYALTKDYLRQPCDDNCQFSAVTNSYLYSASTLIHASPATLKDSQNLLRTNTALGFTIC